MLYMEVLPFIVRAAEAVITTKLGVALLISQHTTLTSKAFLGHVQNVAQSEEKSLNGTQTTVI